MKFKTSIKIILSFLYTINSCFAVHAQDTSINVIQDPKFEKLLNEKRKNNVSLTVNDSYKIQIFSGGSENAKKTLNEFRQEFQGNDATIVFNSPNFKVLIGNFRTRIESEKFLALIVTKYRNSILIKPSKSKV